MPRRHGGSGSVFAAMVAGACASAPDAPQPDPAAGIDGRHMPAGAVTALATPTETGAEPVRIEEYLRGRVPGLEVIEVGGSFTLRLRGGDLSLMSGSNRAPLVVLDGMPIAHELMSQVLRTVRPGDIKEIRVLRDVASTSVYGMRGSAGVILIRTIDRCCTRAP